MAAKKTKTMEIDLEAPLSLLQLPDTAIVEVLRNLDATSLVALEQTAPFFHRKDPITRLPLTEHIARELVLRECGSLDQATRFRNRSWKERLYLERNTGCGFDREFCEEGGFSLQTNSDASQPDTIRLTGMGPKLLLSDLTTKDQPVLRWRLLVKGNTAVEFGVIPVGMPPSHTALHKCLAVPSASNQRCVGFCSQITAGSLLPLKAPVMRGTVVDIVARRGHIEVVLMYPSDAKEIHWQNGQPIHRRYRGPSQLRFEQDFDADYDIRLAVTSWAKACFDVMHTSTTGQSWTPASATSGPRAGLAVLDHMMVDEHPVPSIAAAAALQAHLLQQAAAQLPPAVYAAAPVRLELLQQGVNTDEKAIDAAMEALEVEPAAAEGGIANNPGINQPQVAMHVNVPTPAGVSSRNVGGSTGGIPRTDSSQVMNESHGSPASESRGNLYWDGQL